MTWATASLLVQKFVITLVGSTAYKMTATIAAVIYLIAVASGLISGRIAAMAKAAFEFLGWITLATVLAIWVSISMTSEWLGDSLSNAERDLQAFKLEAIQLQGLITGRFVADIETSTALEDQITSISEAIEETQARLSTAEENIVKLESRLEAARPERSWIEVLRSPWGGEDSSEIQLLEDDLLSAGAKAYNRI
jgi:septal ring factor EnvC (AmiA/AmiB activator)